MFVLWAMCVCVISPVFSYVILGCQDGGLYRCIVSIIKLLEQIVGHSVKCLTLFINASCVLSCTDSSIYSYIHSHLHLFIH